MLFLTVLFVVAIAYPYLSTSYPNLITGGIFEGAAVVVFLLYGALKLKGSSEKKHHYSSPRGAKKTKPKKKNPFLLD